MIPVLHASSTTYYEVRRASHSIMHLSQTLSHICILLTCIGRYKLANMHHLGETLLHAQVRVVAVAANPGSRTVFCLTECSEPPPTQNRQVACNIICCVGIHPTHQGWWDTICLPPESKQASLLL